MQTARARPELLTGEEFGAIHPLRDFTSPGRGDGTAPSTTRLKRIFFDHISANPFFRAEVKPKHEAERWVGMGTAVIPTQHSTYCPLLWHRRLIHSFSAAKIF